MRYNLRLRQSLDELVKSLLEEVETLVAWFRRLSLKRRQIAAKQQFWKLFTHTIRGKEKANANCKLQQKNKKCLLVTIWRKKTNYKLQQKNHLHHLGKRKSKIQIAAKQNKKCFMSAFGKRKSILQIAAKKWRFFKMFLHFILFNICQCSAGLVSGRKKGWVPPNAFSIDSLIYFFSCKGSISISDRIILLIFIFSHFIRRNFSLDILDWQSLMRNRGVRNKTNKQTPKWNLHWSSQEQPSSDHKDCL